MCSFMEDGIELVGAAGRPRGTYCRAGPPRSTEAASQHARGEMQLNEMSRIAGRQRYSRPVMPERRRRILAEARALLAEAGEPGFNLRALSRRAGVSARSP